MEELNYTQSFCKVPLRRINPEGEMHVEGSTIDKCLDEKQGLIVLVCS